MYDVWCTMNDVWLYLHVNTRVLLHTHTHHTCTHTHTHTHTYVESIGYSPGSNIRTCRRIQLQTCKLLTHLCVMYVCMYVCVCVCVYVREKSDRIVRMRVLRVWEQNKNETADTYTHTHSHTCIHTYTHNTHTHTHTHLHELRHASKAYICDGIAGKWYLRNSRMSYAIVVFLCVCVCVRMCDVWCVMCDVWCVICDVWDVMFEVWDVRCDA